MNQFGLATTMRFALLVRCLSSSITRRFLFSSLESVVKWNVTIFVYTKSKQKQLSISVQF